ncbi:GNAT family N-acetyltransferase [Longivirga aurantiaca]|uniref:GNAT family N-acetyltransferase n=1 Tax=Longivirga aurantiaca TaxID=1837743 RepID=A0ABW1T3Q0_9ACTN
MSVLTQPLVAPAPLARPAQDSDLTAILDVYAACRASDPTYPAAVGSATTPDLAEWFFRKPLAACLVVENADRVIVGVAGLSAAAPPQSARGDRRVHWMESCRLAVHPEHRGGAASRALTSARMRAASDLGADRLWLRCLPGSPAHGLYLRVGWSFLSRGHIDVPGEASRPAVLLQRAVPAMPTYRVVT